MSSVHASPQDRAMLSREGVLDTPRLTLLMLPAGVILLALSIAPLAIAPVWSFWRWDPTIYWIVPDFSLKAYAALFTTGRVNVLIRTASLALVAASLSVLIGFMIAYFLYRVAGRR